MPSRAIDFEQHFGELRQVIGGPEVHARGEWAFELLPELRLTAGLDFSAWFAGGEYRGPRPTQDGRRASRERPARNAAT